MIHCITAQLDQRVSLMCPPIKKDSWHEWCSAWGQVTVWCKRLELQGTGGSDPLFCTSWTSWSLQKPCEPRCCYLHFSYGDWGAVRSSLWMFTMKNLGFEVCGFFFFFFWVGLEFCATLHIFSMVLIGFMCSHCEINNSGRPVSGFGVSTVCYNSNTPLIINHRWRNKLAFSFGRKQKQNKIHTHTPTLYSYVIELYWCISYL